VGLNARAVAQRINHCLDDSDAPAVTRERVSILSKILNIPKHQAWGLIEGHQVPDDDLLQRIAEEFEVDTKWLIGEK